MAIDPALAPASVTTSGVSAPFTGPYGIGTYEAVATVAAWLTVGATAIAGAAKNIYLPAGVPRVFYVETAGSTISVIQDTAAGKVNLTPCL